MEWELSKENYQPLRRGRKASAVTSGEEALKTSCPKTAAAAREEQRRAFWTKISDYDGSDPLEVWLRFIRWVQEAYREGGHQSELIPLLERCTRELQGHEEYKQDARYLRVWLQYADCLPEPRDVFNFLKANEIGLGWSMYYESFATYLELRGSFQKAEEVYTEGINRRAQPEGRLKQKLATFQKRMDERNKKRAEEQELGPSFEETLEANSKRNTLEALAASRPGRAVPAVRSTPRSLLGSKGLGQTRPGTLSNRQPTGLSVFEDDNLDDPGTVAAGANWAKLPTFEQSRRENHQKAMPWAGAKLPQKRHLLAKPSQPPALLDIHQDDDIEEVHQAQPGSDEPQPTLRQRLESAGGESDLHERLMANPLLLHGQCQDPKVEKHDGSHTASAARASRAPKGVVFAWDDDRLRGDGTDELSFEEMRAMQCSRKATGAPKPKAASKTKKKPLSTVSAPPPLAGGGLQIFDDSCESEAPAESGLSFQENTGSGPLCIFDDSEETEAKAGAPSGLSLSIREDTGLLGLPSSEAQPSSPMARLPAHGILSVPAAPDIEPVGLGIREDKEFLSETHAVNGKTGDSGLGLSIREDTELLTAPTGASAAISGLGFEIREDTDLLSGGLQIREDTGFLGSADHSAESEQGLQIREDTDYITTKPSEGNGLDLGIREDTGLLDKPPLPKSGRPSRRQPLGSVQGSGDVGLGLAIREDTDLLPDGDGGPMEAADCKKPRRRALGTLAEKSQDTAQDLAGTAAEVNALLGSGQDYTEDHIRYSEPTLTFMTEPTVTIATKEAMAAINDMFMSDLQH